MKTRINDVMLYYESHGKGTPIVFSHAWLEDCSIWGPQVAHFAKKYAVTIYDHRGHGRSDNAPKADYSVQTLANDLYAFIQKLKLEEGILVGFSLGGMVSILFALEHPDKLSKLVLVGTTAKFPRYPSLILGVLRYVLPYKTVARSLCKQRFHKPSTQMVETSFARAMTVDSNVAYQSLKEYTKCDFRDRVRKIEAPTLIIVGEKDRINLEAGKYLNREIEDSELRIVPGSGHAVMVEKSEEFNQILEEFIR